MPLRGGSSGSLGQCQGPWEGLGRAPCEELLPHVCVLELVPRELLAGGADLGEPPVEEVAQFEHARGGELGARRLGAEELLHLLLCSGSCMLESALAKGRGRGEHARRRGGEC